MDRIKRRASMTTTLAGNAGRDRPWAMEALETRQMLSGPPTADPSGDLWDGSLPATGVQLASINAGVLRFEGAFIMNTSTQRLENRGAVTVGLRPTGAEPFRPLLSVTGSMRYDQSKVFAFEGVDVDALIAGSGATRLFSGGFSIGFADSWTRSLTETDPVAGLSLGPATFSLASLQFANPFGGSTSDSRVSLRGGLNLPSVVGGGTASVQGASYATIAPEGLTFTGAAVLNAAGTSVQFPTLRLNAAANVWVDFAQSSGAPGAGQLRVSGQYTLPDFSNASVTLSGPAGADPTYIISAGTPGNGTLSMNAAMRVDGLNITANGAWRLDNVRFEALAATTIVTTNAYLYMGGNTPTSVTARVIANKRVEIDFTYQPGPDLFVHGAAFDLAEPGGFFFTSDKTPTANGRADNWDPEVKLFGNLHLQHNADGSAPAQLVFAVPAGAPMKANTAGASMPALTQVGPQAGVQLLGIRRATLTNTTIELRVNEPFLRLETTAKYAEFNDQTIDFRGEDDFGFDLFIKIKDDFDVGVDGFLTLDPIDITAGWKFDEFFFWVQPFAMGSQSGFKGTAKLEAPLRQGANAYDTNFLVTSQAFDFTVVGTPGPAFLAAGMPVTVAALSFTPDRTSPPNDFSVWAPQIALAGVLPIPAAWGGFVLGFGPPTPIMVNENGIDVSGGFAMPVGQTFKIIDVVNVTTVAGLVMRVDLANNKATLDGTFTLPSLGGAVLDSRAVNGHSFELTYDPNTQTTDFAANATTAANTQAPIWTVFNLVNINVGVSKQYGQPGVMGGTATLQTNLNPIALTLNFVNGVLQPTSGPLNAISNSFSFIGTLLGPVDFTFIPDRAPGVGPDWDPTFTFGGAITLPNGFGDGTFLVPLNNIAERILLTVDGLDLSAQVKIPNQNFDFKVGGQTIKLKSTNVIISVGKPPGQPFFLKFQGKLEITQSVWFLPQSIEADLEAPNNYFSINSAGVINAVGKITAKKMNLTKSGTFQLKEFTLGFNTVTNTWSGDGKLKIPKVPATLVGGVEFIDGYINRITIGVDDLGIQIYGNFVTKTGIFFEGATATVNNLAPGSPSIYVELGGSVHLKAGQALPSALQFDITLPEFLGGETHIDGKIVDAKITGAASLGGVKGSAEVKVIGNIIKGTLAAELNWASSPVYFKLDGSLSVLAGLYTYTGGVRIDSAGNFSARGGVSLQIPTGFHTLFSGRLSRWLASKVEGTTIAGSQGGVKFTNDGVYSNDVVYAYGTAFGQVFGAKVYFNGTIGTILSQSALAGLRVPGEFIVNPGTSEATFFVAWDNDSTTPPFELRDPDGNLVTDYDVVADYAGTKNFGIVVHNPAAGTWKIAVTDATGLGDVVYEGYEPNAAPTVAITSPLTDVQSPGTVNIGYEAFDPDNDADISFYYSDQFGEFSGIPIGTAVEQDGSGAFVWNTAGLPSGDYTIYAEIDDGFHELNGAFAVGRITVISPDAPAQVTGTEFLWLGGTKASLSWDSIADADYYVVSYTPDAAGPAYTQFFTVEGETSLTLSDYTPGETYTFSVRSAMEAVTEGAESNLGIRGTPVTGVIGYMPTVPSGLGEWDVFADPDTAYSASISIPSGGSAVLLVAPAGATLDGSGNFSWTVPGSQDGWSDVVVKITDGDGTLSIVRYALLSDANRTIDLGGQTWEDADNSGDRAFDENGLSGVTVKLVDAETGAVLLTLTSADDDRDNSSSIDAYSEQGLYRFTGLTPGRYIVRVDPGSNIATAPVSGEYDRTLAKGLADDELDFGIYIPSGGISAGGGLAHAGTGGVLRRTLAGMAADGGVATLILFESEAARSPGREPWRAITGAPSFHSVRVARAALSLGIEPPTAGVRPEVFAEWAADEFTTEP